MFSPSGFQIDCLTPEQTGTSTDNNSEIKELSSFHQQSSQTEDVFTLTKEHLEKNVNKEDGQALSNLTQNETEV